MVASAGPCTKNHILRALISPRTRLLLFLESRPTNRSMGFSPCHPNSCADRTPKQQNRQPQRERALRSHRSLSICIGCEDSSAWANFADGAASADIAAVCRSKRANCPHFHGINCVESVCPTCWSKVSSFQPLDLAANCGIDMLFACDRSEGL